MNDEQEEEEPEDSASTFREPSGNFRDILSRWDRQATAEEAHMAHNRCHVAGHAFRRNAVQDLKKKIFTNRQLSASHHAPRSSNMTAPSVVSGTEGQSHDNNLAALEGTVSEHRAQFRQMSRKMDTDNVYRRNAPTKTTQPNDFLSDESAFEMEDPSFGEDEDGGDQRIDDRPKSTAAHPTRSKVSDRIGMFNQQSNGKAPFSIPKFQKKPTDGGTTDAKTVKELAHVPPSSPSTQPSSATNDQQSTTPSTTTTSATPSTRTDATETSPAKRHWSKLKTAGLAVRAAARLQKRLVHRMPKNIYQKPLHTHADFVPPQFHHTADEIHVIRKALRKNFVFADLSETELTPFVQAFEKCTFAAQQVIIRQGQTGDYFYIIFDGKVSFDVHGTAVGRAGKGNSFGELALLYTCPRAATVTALRDSTLFRVDQNTFRFILKNQTRESENEKLQLLRGVDFFAELSPVDLEKLSNVMTPRVFTPDVVLCKKGEMGDMFYVLQEGEVLITDISVGSTTYADQTLGPGQYFGERSLVTGEPRAANVIAKSYGVAFTIDRATFQKTVGQIADIISRSQDGRRLAGVNLLQGANLTPKQITALAQVMNDICYMSGKTILRKGELSSPALYFVREGSVRLEKKGKVVEVSPGGFFGEELMQLAVRKHMINVPSPITATSIGKTVLAELRLSHCRSTFDVQLLAGRSSEAFSLGDIESDDEDDEDEEELVVERLKALRARSEETFKPKIRPKVKLEDLEKIKLLGAGTFGQVWLVSDKTKTRTEESVFALKVQTKWDLVEEGQVEAVIREQQIMKKMFHPFIVDFVASFQDTKFLYMVISLIQGGELFSRIHDEERDGNGLDESQAKFYALCIADALAYLHRLGYVFRDLKPENVMLDAEGYPKLIDFGFAKHITEKTFTLCGTPGYLPPEIVMSRGHDWSADHWSFGVLIYDMVTGTGPFYAEGMDQMTLFQCIVEGSYDEPRGASCAAKDLISKLLQKEPLQRLGSLSRGEQDILEHSWFAGLDLSAMRSRKTEAPWLPNVKDVTDTSCFDDWDDLVDKMTEDIPDLKPKDAALFDKWGNQ